MKQIEIENITKVTKYEAIDGTLFSSKEECVKYEETAKCVLLGKYKRLVVKSTKEDTFYKTGSDEVDIDIVKLGGNADISLILQLHYYYHSGDYAKEYAEKIENTCNKALREDDYLIIYRGDCYDDNFWVRYTRNEFYDHITAICNETDKA